MVVCSEQLNSAFIWNGLEFEETPDGPSRHQFVSHAVEEYFGRVGRQLDSVRIVEEQPTSESDEFLNQF